MALGPTNPQMIVIAEETLGLRRLGFSPNLRLLVPTFSLPSAPEALTGPPSQRAGNALLPRRASPPLITQFKISKFEFRN